MRDQAKKTNELKKKPAKAINIHCNAFNNLYLFTYLKIKLFYFFFFFLNKKLKKKNNRINTQINK